MCAQIKTGLEAMKVDLWFAVGALLLAVNFGYLRDFLRYCLVLSLITSLSARMTVLIMWMDSALALCLPAISLYMSDTAELRVEALYSLYMFTISFLVLYLRTIPKFLMEDVFLSKISLREMISP